MPRLSERQQDALELLYQDGAYLVRENVSRDYYAYVETPDGKIHNVHMNTFLSLHWRKLIVPVSGTGGRFVISSAGRELIAPLLCHCLEDDCTRVHSPAPETA